MKNDWTHPKGCTCVFLILRFNGAIGKDQKLSLLQIRVFLLFTIWFRISLVKGFLFNASFHFRDIEKWESIFITKHSLDFLVNCSTMLSMQQLELKSPFCLITKLR